MKSARQCVKECVTKLLTVCPRFFNYLRSKTTLLTNLFREGEINNILILCFFPPFQLSESMKSKFFNTFFYLSCFQSTVVGGAGSASSHWLSGGVQVFQRAYQAMEFPAVWGEFITKTCSINMKDFYLGLGQFYNLFLTFLYLPLDA